MFPFPSAVNTPPSVNGFPLVSMPSRIYVYDPLRFALLNGPFTGTNDPFDPQAIAEITSPRVAPSSHLLVDCLGKNAYEDNFGALRTLDTTRPPLLGNAAFSHLTPDFAQSCARTQDATAPHP